MPTKQQMKAIVKSKAISILKLEDKATEMAQAIENGDTNLFFIEMFGNEPMLISKLIMSLQTTFGMSFYEQISKSLGELVGYTVENQYSLEGYIPDAVKTYLSSLLDNTSYTPNRVTEYARLAVLYQNAHDKGQIGTLAKIPDSTVDVFIRTPDGTEIFIDITTVKPNKKEFRTMKEKILKWYFLRLSHGNIRPEKIKTFIAIPYNPESRDTNEYKRWGNYYDRADLLVGDELWKLVSAGHFSLNDMIDVFREIGNESKARLQQVLAPKQH